MRRLALCILFVSSLGVMACSKKPCGPATAPDYAQEFVLKGGQVCKASDGGGGVTMSIHYADLDEPGLQELYKTDLTSKGYKFTGSNGIFFAAKGKDAPNMVTTIKDKERGGATAVVKVFPK